SVTWRSQRRSGANSRPWFTAMRRRGVRPGILERLEASAALADFVEHVEQIARRTRQPIEPHDHQHIGGPAPADPPVKLPPLSRHYERALMTPRPPPPPPRAPPRH